MKANDSKWLRGAAVSSLVSGITALVCGCSQPGEVVHTNPPPNYVTYYDDSPRTDLTPPPAPSPAYYDYDYYPDWNVYYYPAGSTYYWYDNGTWVSGSRLPPRYVIRTARHEHVHSQSREPWGAEQKPFDGSGKPPDEFGHQP